MKVAIVGAGVTGLSCALELERHGIYADLFERDNSIGWIWPSANYWPSLFYRDKGDIIEYLKSKYNIIIKPSGVCKTIMLKSPNETARINGDLGYFITRGKGEDSIEQQLKRDLKRTVLCFNNNADYKRLSKEYDWVVVATGNDAVARELEVWEEEGIARAIGGIVVGNFDPHTAYLYLNTKYAGSGYARMAPFSSTQAVVSLFTIGCGEFDILKQFSAFLYNEGLTKLEFLYKMLPQPFTTGKVRKYKIGNILLAGRSAGLTERLVGVGGPEGIMSGILAARAIAEGEDYTKQIKKIRKHIENVSSFRKVIEKFNNEDYDKLIAAIDIKGVKKIIYNTKINHPDIIGSLLKHVTK
ncbi:MAG: FAD-dependent oxidoreductase [Caulobacteraceae bacterium]